ncbi:hypothetical protein ACM40_12670 [Chryseobacterium sp. BLS98]|nr:hypothetical protein ACM40_12670 [Chryseobacterium sp. BLS98]
MENSFKLEMTDLLLKKLELKFFNAEIFKRKVDIWWLRLPKPPVIMLVYNSLFTCEAKIHH